MFRFNGFKASLNFSSGKRSSSDYVENIPSLSSTNGAYRVNKEEFIGTSSTGGYSDHPKKITPSMVKLPASSKTTAVKPSKSTGDLTQTGVPQPPPLPPPNSAVRPTKSTSDLAQNIDGKAPSTDSDTKYQINIIPIPNINKATSKLAKTTVTTAEPNDQPTLRNAKSDNALRLDSKIPPQLRNTSPNVSSDPKGGPGNYRDSADLRKVNSKDAKKQEKERKMVEKKRLAEQKKNEKLAAQEQAKQEKLRKEKEKQEAKLAKQKAKKEKEKDKSKKTPVPKPRTNPLAQGPGPSPTTNTVQTQVSAQSQTTAPMQGPPQYTTNTLESSISRTSGPPAYTENPVPRADLIQSEHDASGNTSFTKTIANSDYSWDLIDQHRQQISRPPVSGGSKPKQRVMDLQYHPGRPSGDNTEVTINPPRSSVYI